MSTFFEPENLPDGSVKIKCTHIGHLMLAVSLMKYWAEKGNITLSVEEINLGTSPYFVIVRIEGCVLEQLCFFMNMNQHDIMNDL